MTTETVEPKNETPGEEALLQDELLARGWAALPDSYRIPEVAPTLDEARAWCKQLAESHYENFHVASWFLPKDLRPHFHAIYAYCRVSDDLGDEVGDPSSALALLDLWGRELDACYEGRTRHPVFVALAETIRECFIPKEPFADLLVAFRQDQTVTRYETMDDVLAYCRYSANPVGRLVLYACGERERRELPPLRRDLHRAATGQLLAGCARGLRQGPHLYSAERHGVLRRHRGVHCRRRRHAGVSRPDALRGRLCALRSLKRDFR